MRRTWKSKMIWPKVRGSTLSTPQAHLLTYPQAQKILRDLKSKISSQSKKNFVLEKDVRYLDSRIALLIQNRMALEEVRSELPHLARVLTIHSKMKLPAISKTLQIFKRVSSQMMRRLRNMATYSSYYNPSLGILHTSVA